MRGCSVELVLERLWLIQAFLSLISRSKSMRLIISSPVDTEALIGLLGADNRLKITISSMAEKPRVIGSGSPIPSGWLRNQLSIGRVIKVTVTPRDSCRKGAKKR